MPSLFLYMGGGSAMNRHYRHGFQRTFTNDIYHVERRLREYDPHLYVMYSPKTGEHLIMDGLLEIAIMRIPQKGFETLDARVVSHIKRIHTANGFSAGQIVDKAEEKRLREQDKTVDDIAYNMARDMKRAVKNHAYGYV